MPTTLSVASFNAENFFLLLDRPYGRDELEAIDEPTYKSMAASLYNLNKSRSKTILASLVFSNSVMISENFVLV